MTELVDGIEAIMTRLNALDDERGTLVAELIALRAKLNALPALKGPRKRREPAAAAVAVVAAKRSRGRPRRGLPGEVTQ